MTEQKTEYIGRYGEVLEDVHETKKSLEKKDPKTRTLEAVGLDENGVKRKVLFRVSRKTGKKHGKYTIYRPKEERQDILLFREEAVIEECDYLNDLLHGKDTFYNDLGDSTKEIYFLRGKQLEGKGFHPYLSYYTGCSKLPMPTIGLEEKKQRDNAAKKSIDLRKLFSDASVKEAIKTGNLVKVKSAMTRALRKKEMGE